MSAQKAVKEGPERILMLGWNRRGPSIAYELSRFVLDGSSLHIVAELPAAGSGGDAGSDRALLQSRDHAPAEGCDAGRRAEVARYPVLRPRQSVLGYTDSLSPQSADTRTLVTLLQIRKLTDAAGKYVNVVSAMADSRNRALAEVRRAQMISWSAASW